MYLHSSILYIYKLLTYYVHTPVHAVMQVTIKLFFKQSCVKTLNFSESFFVQRTSISWRFNKDIYKRMFMN